MNKAAWNNFISGAGVDRLIINVEKIKKELRNIFKRKKFDRKRWLITTIRLEHLQIKKHQKLALKYLQELDELLMEVEMKEERRASFIETYKVK